ncbi:MAG: hypothetical protein JO227_20790 [Acetobacteraceae bacterium]|nr:hypothetical protein [Acetobacteraceae bacterium]
MTPEFNLDVEIARIDREREETRQFCAEMRRRSLEALRDPASVWQILVLPLLAGAGLMAAAMVFGAWLAGCHG